MGFFKNLFAGGEPPFKSMEPQSVRYEWLAMRLPPDWRFTHADNRGFAVAGPAGCSAQCRFLTVRGFDLKQFDKHRKVVEQIMQRSVRDPAAKVSGSGVLWAEGGGAAAHRIAIFNSRPRDRDGLAPPILELAAASPTTEALEPLRAALRGIQWN
jgi:hypothetical protein